ncbi:MAG: cellulase-like family protein [Pseudomonadota bacterium]
MDRKQFLGTLTAGALMAATGVANAAPGKRKAAKKGPLAITMWDFSWLERRWPGAGYEDWDVALDGLVERGYNAVRIDAYPHLVAKAPHKEWTLLPQWNTQDWGSPDINRVTILPALTEFIGKCHRRGIRVGLSSWYREDADKTRMQIDSPERMAADWIVTLEHIKRAGLMDAIVYVDLCNEWPLHIWAPWFQKKEGSDDWTTPASLDYMKRAVAKVRAAYPGLPALFSFFNARVEDYLDHKPDFDLFEHHIWMAQQNDGEYYKEVGYNYERFDPKGYTALGQKAKAAYRARPDYWNSLLVDKINRTARVARQLNKPLVTTECWSLVDYKDWPLLEWDWIKDINALGVATASKTGQWLGIATSNFCGPQFKGMWNDVRWHQAQTTLIKNGPVTPELKSSLLWGRL